MNVRSISLLSLSAFSLVALSHCVETKQSSQVVAPSRAPLPEYSDSEVTAKLGGTDWVPKFVIAKKFDAADERYAFHFYSSNPAGPTPELADKACEFFNRIPADDKSISITAAAIVGETLLGKDAKGVIQTMGFVWEKDGDLKNAVTDNGKITIDSADGDTVTGRIVGQMEDSSINGKFTATLCK
jgi:hypothetical protein